jgi:RNA polymerase sigma-70 factor (ECF subfamily)
MDAFKMTMGSSCLEGPPSALGREEQFLQLFLGFERRIHAFIFTLVPVWSDADDILQETSIVLWSKFDAFRPGSDFLAWALSVARFQVLNHRKKQRSSLARLSNQCVEALADQLMTQRDEVSDQRRALADCLAKLKADDRELIQLRYLEGATTQDVADQVGRSLKAVYKALNRIHMQLLLCMRRNLGMADAL